MRSWTLTRPGVVGYAEEAHKLAGSITAGRRWTAAVQRSLLALRLAPILAVHERILYETENHLWELVAAALGEDWRRAQATALGLSGEPLPETCRAALTRFAPPAARAAVARCAAGGAVAAHALAGSPLSE